MFIWFPDKIPRRQNPPGQNPPGQNPPGQNPLGQSPPWTKSPLTKSPEIGQTPIINIYNIILVINFLNFKYEWSKIFYLIYAFQKFFYYSSFSVFTFPKAVILSKYVNFLINWNWGVLIGYNVRRIKRPSSIFNIKHSIQ